MGQRIRFAKTPSEHEAIPSEGAKTADDSSLMPRKPRATPPNDARPAASHANAPASQVARRAAIVNSHVSEEIIGPGTFAPDGDVIPPHVMLDPGDGYETPPPFLVEPDSSIPMFGAQCGPDCAPSYSRRRTTLGGIFGLSGNPCAPGMTSLRRFGVFGEFLYLRPRDTEVAFVVPGNGLIQPGINPIPVGTTYVVDPDHAPGYRGGVNIWTDDWTSIQAKYTLFESSTSNGVQLTPDQIAQGFQLHPLTVHPLTIIPNTTAVASNAALDVDFEMIDADMRRTLWCSPDLMVNGYAGARWANLEQAFGADYLINQGVSVRVNSDYEGVGPRIGVDGSAALGCGGFGFYARSEVSFLYGAARADFIQFEVNNRANPQAFTDWKADRLSPLYELELGFQWTGPQRRLRLSAGYMMNVWFNVVTAEDFIQGVQQNYYDDLGDTVTFDGVTARAEFRL